MKASLRAHARVGRSLSSPCRGCGSVPVMDTAASTRLTRVRPETASRVADHEESAAP